MQFRANVSEAMNEEYSDWLCLYVIKMCVCVCVWKSRWTSWAPDPNKPMRFCGRKATLQRVLVVCVCQRVCVCVWERERERECVHLHNYIA